LPEALALQVRVRLDPQAGAVGMRAYQAQPLFGQRLAAELKGDDRRVVAGDVIATTGFGDPALAFIQRLEACSLQAARQAGGVLRAWEAPDDKA